MAVVEVGGDVDIFFFLVRFNGKRLPPEVETDLWRAINERKWDPSFSNFFIPFFNFKL